MTSTNINFLEQAVSKFKSLDTDDRLTVLGLLYTEITDEVPAIALSDVPNESTTNLLGQIQQLSQAEQLVALRQLFHQDKKEETSISIADYTSMSTDCKLAFWYHLAQNLGASIIGIPNDYIPSEKAAEVLDLLQTANIEDVIIFLKQVV